jgi:hypothetical protein
LFTYQEEAAARLSETTPIGPAKHPKDEAQGLHKTSIYNTLAKGGQTSQLEKNGTSPVSRQILNQDADAKRW